MRPRTDPDNIGDGEVARATRRVALNPPTDRPRAAAVTVLAVDDQPIFPRAAQQLRMAALDSHIFVVLVSLEETPDLPASLATVRAAVHLRKQDLSASALQEIWAAHGGSLPS